MISDVKCLDNLGVLDNFGDAKLDLVLDMFGFLEVLVTQNSNLGLDRFGFYLVHS